MPQGHRPDRVGDQIRQELSDLLSRGVVHDPGIGFITLTRVKMSADLQLARVFYTMMGDATARRDTAACGLRSAQPPQRENEERRRGKIARLCEMFGPAHGRGRRSRNIFSMRSVMRKPLTMLVMDAKSAMHPSTVM